MTNLLLVHWTVDLGEGPKPVRVPHAWQQDVSLTWEGPAVYETELEVPRGEWILRFHGVSYSADVQIDGESVLYHEGIWDWFDISLAKYGGKKVSIRVSVTKNGGATYPADQVASGSLPEIFHTFGGIYKPVELLRPPRPASGASTSRDLSELPFLRGVVRSPWFPWLGHCNPPEEVIREEASCIADAGFNLVVFDRWLPPHQYLDVLKSLGIRGWLNLPAAPETELERIIRQYFHHETVIGWSLQEPHPYIEQLIRNLTGGAYVAEAQPLESELEFIPELASGRHIRWENVPTHRDLARIGDELPFWASSLSELNDAGVRRNRHLSHVVAESRFSNEPTKSAHRQLMTSSAKRASFVRKWVAEQVRQSPSIQSFWIDSWSDTPSEASGMVDDWSDVRTEDVHRWNSPMGLYIEREWESIPWFEGTRSSGKDPFNQGCSGQSWRIGIRSDVPLTGGLIWRVMDGSGAVVRYGVSEPVSVVPQVPTWVGTVMTDLLPGKYVLATEFAVAQNQWSFWVVDEGLPEINLIDPMGLCGPVALANGQVISVGSSTSADIAILIGEGTIAQPFWRHSILHGADRAPLGENWCRHLAVAPDRVLDPAYLDDTYGTWESVVTRIDARTYEELPVLVKAGNRWVTTLRPFGGLGVQPKGLANNFAGQALLRGLLA